MSNHGVVFFVIYSSTIHIHFTTKAAFLETGSYKYSNLYVRGRKLGTICIYFSVRFDLNIVSYP